MADTSGDGHDRPNLLPSPTIAAFRSFRHPLADGASTGVHIAAYPRRRVSMRVVVLPDPEPLESWCRREAVGDALVGGFFVTPVGTPLGELWVAGLRAPSAPFHPPSGPGRSCVAVDGRRVRIDGRGAPAGRPAGRPPPGRPPARAPRPRRGARRP